MTPAQIKIVKKNWQILRRISPAVVADAFYSKLFLDHPELRRMFPLEMEAQYSKLIEMLSMMVARLENTVDFSLEMAAMGKRHVGYGVQAKHYAMVGSALLWTLEQGLGDDWTEEAAEAWRACYGAIEKGMTG